MQKKTTTNQNADLWNRTPKDASQCSSCTQGSGIIVEEQTQIFYILHNISNHFLKQSNMNKDVCCSFIHIVCKWQDAIKYPKSSKFSHSTELIKHNSYWHWSFHETENFPKFNFIYKVNTYVYFNSIVIFTVIFILLAILLVSHFELNYIFLHIRTLIVHKLFFKIYLFCLVFCLHVCL